MIKSRKSNFAIFFLFLTIQAFVINPVYAAFQSAADGKLLEKAENFYYDGDFDNAIKSANQFISQASLSKEDRKNAYILLVHIFLAKSDATSAKKVVESILNSDPSYAPTLEVETPKYVTFVTEIKKQYLAKKAKAKPKKKEIDWVLWGGAGAGATLLIILLASGGSDNDPPKLSSPPNFPDN